MLLLNTLKKSIYSSLFVWSVLNYSYLLPFCASVVAAVLCLHNLICINRLFSQKKRVTTYCTVYCIQVYSYRGDLKLIFKKFVVNTTDPDLLKFVHVVHKCGWFCLDVANSKRGTVKVKMTNVTFYFK